jgi:hypothetical protein
MHPATILLGMLAVLAGSPAAAQDPSALQDPSAPMRDPEAMNYQLSMEKLHKLVEVQRALNALNASDPELFERIDRETAAIAKKKGTSPTVGERVAVLDRNPRVQRVFNEAGGTSRDWMLTGLAMGNAFLALEVKMGRLSPEHATSPTTAAQKANLALLENNQAEWQKIQEELERLGDELD